MRDLQKCVTISPDSLPPRGSTGPRPDSSTMRGRERAMNGDSKEHKEALRQLGRGVLGIDVLVYTHSSPACLSEQLRFVTAPAERSTECICADNTSSRYRVKQKSRPPRGGRGTWNLSTRAECHLDTERNEDHSHHALCPEVNHIQAGAHRSQRENGRECGEPEKRLCGHEQTV